MTVAAPGQSNDWLVTFYDTITGGVLQSGSTSQQPNGDIDVALPDFSGSIAFQIHPRQPADFDGDGQVGFSDFVLFALAFGTVNPAIDLDGDGFVGFTDFVLFALAFGT